MEYNLTETQKGFARWLVEEIRAERLGEAFHIEWMLAGDGVIVEHTEDYCVISGTPEALAADRLLLVTKTADSGAPKQCSVTRGLFEAVDSDFNAPDISFVRHLTPLADITDLDEEIKSRCLPNLGAGSADPVRWDSAARDASVILEERIRDVGAIRDNGRIGLKLVNDVFGQSGTLANRFDNASAREGYRDLFAGIVGVFRNESAHRFIDPSPQDGGAYIVFVDLLLRKLEDLRKNSPLQNEELLSQ